MYADLIRVTAHGATAFCKDRDPFNGPGNDFQSFTVLSIVRDQYLLDGGIPRFLPLLSPDEGLEPRRNRVRPLEPKVSRDFFEAIGICWKIDLRIGDPQEIHRAGNECGDVGGFGSRVGISARKSLEKGCFIGSIVNQDRIVDAL